jgi:hypothetical protein
MIKQKKSLPGRVTNVSKRDVYKKIALVKKRAGNYAPVHVGVGVKVI